MGEGRERLELWRLHLQSILQGSPTYPDLSRQVGVLGNLCQRGNLEPRAQQT